MCLDSPCHLTNSAPALSVALEGQVLELHLLQVHLYFWRPERADRGRGGDVVPLVCCSHLPPPHGSVMQGPL